MATHRTSIINACLKELSRHKKVVGSEAIAATLKVDESQVRGALTRYARIHPDGPVVRVAVGFFRWNEDASPVSAQPSTPISPDTPVPGAAKPLGQFGSTLSDEERAMFHEAAAMAQWEHGAPIKAEPPAWTGVARDPLPPRFQPPAHVCDFTTVKRTADVVLLLEEATQTLWAARKI